MPGEAEVVVWVPKPGGTMLFGTRMTAACLDGLLLWVPKDYYLLLFSTRGSASKRWDDESWVLKRAQKGGIVTQRMCGLSERATFCAVCLGTRDCHRGVPWRPNIRISPMA